MFPWIVFGIIGAVLTIAVWLDRNPRVKKFEEQIEYNERRTKAFDEASRYNNMNS
ncbi:hypothetical protein SAMN04487936_101538 [Halobacillus dabanensis]|uniref:Uncharacterized protein n=1 Tax=Halobacillus dabanensis TaxID=240302 RepID=A0A1I3Q535_HALDA|nr:hypothetical protein [Halobacillus dabanensis]SFJ28789.1 hypothetical protein SAMN04487936_101538 [Halobacillus dabanensis]